MFWYIVTDAARNKLRPSAQYKARHIPHDSKLHTLILSSIATAFKHRKYIHNDHENSGVLRPINYSEQITLAARHMNSTGDGVLHFDLSTITQNLSRGTPEQRIKCIMSALSPISQVKLNNSHDA